MTIHTQPKPPGTPTWVDVTTPNAAAARAFYQAVFGWEYVHNPDEFGGYATARIGEHSVAGVVGDPPADSPPQPSAWGLYFATHDIHGDVARAETLGAKVLYPAMEVGPLGSMVILADPAGAVFGLWEAGLHKGAELTDAAGAMTWHELYAPEAKQALAFYTTLLQATSAPMPGGLEYHSLKHGEKDLCGIMQIDPAWGKMPAQWVTYFAVANADETVAKVTAHGGKVMGNIDDSPFGRIAALMDPFGAIFKIVQPPTR